MLRRHARGVCVHCKYSAFHLPDLVVDIAHFGYDCPIRQLTPGSTPVVQTTAADGFEMHFASNHLGYFLLGNLLMGKIIAAKGVVTNVSSTGHELAESTLMIRTFRYVAQ
jgi:NAD(P)-dependent dehydrogenase (short-subunit alcohol dehydrogenase family)